MNEANVQQLAAAIDQCVAMYGYERLPQALADRGIIDPKAMTDEDCQRVVLDGCSVRPMGHIPRFRAHPDHMREVLARIARGPNPKTIDDLQPGA